MNAVNAEFLIRCAAKAMVQCHREHAFAEAAKLATAFEQRGDADGTLVWCLILDAIGALRSDPLAASETVH